MKDGDIEIVIKKKYYAAADGGGLREKMFRDVRTNYGIGTQYTYHWTNTLERMDKYIDVIHSTDIIHKFYEDGAYSSWSRRYFMSNNKIHYSHSWWEHGATCALYFLKNGWFYRVSVEYNPNGGLRNKVYYTADGEKDYAQCYWNGPRLPSLADGSILRKAIPIVNRMETEEAEDKGCGFNFASLEDAVLREEDVDTL